MNIELLLKTKAELNTKVEITGNAFQELCNPHRGAMGLVSDELKATEEYKKLSNEFHTAFQALRNFNGMYAKFLPKRKYGRA